MRNFDMRAATRSDAADLAVLESLASHGLAQWFWQQDVDAGKAEDPFQCGRDRLLNGAGQFGWFNCIVAERDDVVLGSAMFFAVERDDASDIPAPLKPFIDLRNSVADEWFLDTLAVYPANRGQGVGRALLQEFLAQGRADGHSRASLVAEDANTGALALYHAEGFEQRDSAPFQSFGIPSNTQNWLLLTAAL